MTEKAVSEAQFNKRKERMIKFLASKSGNEEEEEKPFTY